MEKIYKLLHEYEHLLDMDFDATCEPFAGIDIIGYNMMNTDSFEMPKEIYLRGNFNVIPNNTDYPITDLTFPIMSKKMIDVLFNVKKFNIKYFQTIIIDDTFLDDYLDKNGKLNQNASLNTSFFAIQFQEFEDVFNYNTSIFKPMRSNPELPGIIKKMVLKEPKNGFPPLFKIKESVTNIFVSEEAKKALEENNIQGCVFEEIEVTC